MRLDQAAWLSDAQKKILSEHHILTAEVLATYELKDSLAHTLPLPDLRQLAKKAREALGVADPLARIGAAAGAKYPAYAGGVKANGRD